MVDHSIESRKNTLKCLKNILNLELILTIYFLYVVYLIVLPINVPYLNNTFFFISFFINSITSLHVFST